MGREEKRVSEVRHYMGGKKNKVSNHSMCG